MTSNSTKTSSTKIEHLFLYKLFTMFDPTPPNYHEACAFHFMFIAKTRTFMTAVILLTLSPLWFLHSGTAIDGITHKHSGQANRHFYSPHHRKWI